MRPLRAAWILVQIVLVVLFVSLIAGQLLGQPMGLSYVETGSMEPTIETADGFVAVPPAIAGSPDTGDVVVFDAEQIEGGGLTTHRIVDETEDGYITKGDANPFTDQDNNEPPVQDAQVVAVVWQPGGGVLTIPFLGTVVELIQSVLGTIQGVLAGVFGRAVLGPQGVGYLIFVFSLVLYWILGFFEADRVRDRDRGRAEGTDPRLFAIGLALLVMSGATAAMLIPAGTQQYDIVSAEFESDNPTSIQQGSTGRIPYRVNNEGFVPTVVVLAAEDDIITTEPDQLTVSRGETKNATVTVTTPPETGAYRYFVTEHRYLQLLPPSVIRGLHDLHPWLPLIAINLVAGLPVYLLSLMGIGSGRIRLRDKTRPKGGLISRWL